MHVGDTVNVTGRRDVKKKNKMTQLKFTIQYANLESNMAQNLCFWLKRFFGCVLLLFNLHLITSHGGLEIVSWNKMTIKSNCGFSEKHWIYRT